MLFETVRVEPDELRLQFEPGRSLECDLHIANVTSQTVLAKLLPSNPRRYKFSSGPKVLLPPYSITDIRVTCEPLSARPYWNDNINVECYHSANATSPLSLHNDALPLTGVAKLRVPVLFLDPEGAFPTSTSIFSSASLARTASVTSSSVSGGSASSLSSSARVGTTSNLALNSVGDDLTDATAAALGMSEPHLKRRDAFIAELGEALTDSKKQAAALIHEVEELKWQLGQEQHQNKHLKSRVADYEAVERGGGAGGVDDRIEELRTHLAEAEWNAQQAATDVLERDKEIKDLSAKMASMEHEMRGMVEREEAVVALQERTEEKRAALEAELAELQEEMGKVARKKVEMEGDLRRRLAKAESAMAAAQAREKGLGERCRAAVAEARKLKAEALELKTEVARAGSSSKSSFKGLAQVAALRFQKERLLREKESLEKKLQEATGEGAGVTVAAAVAGEGSNETVQKLEQELAHTQELLEAERSAAAEAAAAAAALREAMSREVEELRREMEAMSVRSREEGTARADGQEEEELEAIASASSEELREQLWDALEQLDKAKNFASIMRGQVIEQKKRMRDLEEELKRSETGPLKERLEEVEEEARALGHYVEQLEEERAQGGADPAEVEAMRADLQAMREEVGQRRAEHEHLMQELNNMYRNHQEQLADALHQRDAAMGELRRLQRQLEEEEEARQEAERRRVECERRRASVEQERNETEMQASTLKQKMSRLERQLSELNHARSKGGAQEEQAVKEQAAKVAHLQEEVERLGKMGEEADRLRDDLKVKEEKLKAEEAKVAQFASKLHDITMVNETMERKLKEQSAFETTVYEVTAADTKKPGHVLRLRKKTAYSCAVCKLAGRGLCWRCTHSTCGDYMHTQCLIKK
ncbi:hypothetical protein CLOM_g1001 [Closterium sp. NIES-68]|nr:hypothetical protein CLOM_g1001 [Closterium sp. NIES-68]GJP85066.1 hypothetical protein CLOP_g15169 [Closterium sp. NIES-67]